MKQLSEKTRVVVIKKSSLLKESPGEIKNNSFEIATECYRANWNENVC